MKILLYYFLIVSTLAFAITAYDKYLAKAHKRRISEKSLLSIIAVGGTIGAGIAMLFFRHKTSKKSYLLKCMGIFLLQILLLYIAFFIDL